MNNFDQTQFRQTWHNPNYLRRKCKCNPIQMFILNFHSFVDFVMIFGQTNGELFVVSISDPLYSHAIQI